MHKSNIQLTRVELSTLDVTTKFVKSSKEESSNPRFHNLVSELEGAWKSRDKEKGGREEPEGQSGGQATKIYNTGQTVDELKARKLKESSVEESNRRGPDRQEPRYENIQQKVRYEESLTVQNGQRKRGESAGGAGQ